MLYYAPIGINGEFSDEQNDEGDGLVCGLGHVGCRALRFSD